MKKLIFAITCLLWVVPCSAEIIVVEPDGSGDQPTIQAAINAAYEGDEVVLAIGTYNGDGNRDISFLGKAITVRSTDPNDPDIVASTIIDCNSSSAERRRGFYFHNGEDSNSVLNGLTITNGYTIESGGIYCLDSSPVVTNCLFIRNLAYQGGAIRNVGGNPTITNCTFTGNSARYGGAIYNGNNNPTITNCTFSGNSARREGGAIYNWRGNLAVTNCTFSGNLANRTGGAMYNYRSNPVIKNCILWGNEPDQIQPSSSVVTYSDVQGGWDGVGNIDEEPNFAFDADFHLTPASPCIDAGDPNYVAGPNETDLDGNPR
ncbi:MAG: right-handed parallel beta-helix repeat-containing protein, partial [Planctomycetota bacterium]